MSRGARVAACLLALGAAWLAAPSAVQAQSTATLSGIVFDESGAALPDADVTATNAGTMVERQTVTGRDGQFTVPMLPPGHYVVRVKRAGFTPIEVPDVLLNVNDQIAIRLQLKVAAVGESVSVVAPTSRVSTSPAVGTVVDRQFVENLPLNGRSFQSLLELTPGVVIAPAGSGNETGQFSVNGQRTSANYFTVDGVGANVSIGTAGWIAGAPGAGSLPALTAQGGTNGLVSVDALQEFRIQTSTYGAEFGRMPGGQVSLVTRSGTNALHGSISEYFRNEAMDANDWFANAANLPKARMRQHDVGGVLGGPILRNRTFFFASYETLRLELPQSGVAIVPSLAIRDMAPDLAKPILNAFPRPNGRDFPDLTSEFYYSYSDPSRMHATSVRVDHTLSPAMTMFARVAYAPSVSKTRELSSVSSQHIDNTSVTAGHTWIVTPRLTNDLRVNWTRQAGPADARLDTFGGATVPAVSQIFVPGLSPDNGMVYFGAGGGTVPWGLTADDRQRQLNIVDTLSWTRGAHQIKAGVDYRLMMPIFDTPGNDQIYLGDLDAVGTKFDDLLAGRHNTLAVTVADPTPRHVRFPSLSLWAQDTWTPAARLTLTLGLRWELVPPPTEADGRAPLTLASFDLSGPLERAPNGTPLWDTQYGNFAPRAGAAYQLVQREGRETVLRGGFGRFYDLGYGQVATSFASSYPFSVDRILRSGPLPASFADVVLPRLGIDPPYTLWINDRSLKQPYTYQWNVAVERSLGPDQTVSASYVGAAGRRQLMAEWTYGSRTLAEWPTADPLSLIIARSVGSSDYRALQLQYQRRLSHGLQVLTSYTWGLSQDSSSSESALGALSSDSDAVQREYGRSSYDVRHQLTAAVSYNVPAWRVLGPIGRNWGIDAIGRARSGFPVNASITSVYTANGSYQSIRPDLVPGTPIYIDDAGVPGGTRFNAAAFTRPPDGRQGNFPRNGLNGPGAWQVDLAARREFRLSRLRLQFRGELFNAFNHPNFAQPSGSVTSSLFGQPTQMLNRGLGGLNPLYQIGGPRSGQLSLKVLF